MTSCATSISRGGSRKSVGNTPNTGFFLGHPVHPIFVDVEKKKQYRSHPQLQKRWARGIEDSRHNRVRNLEADLIKEVCHNVQVEPELFPITHDREIEQKKHDLMSQGWGFGVLMRKPFLI